MESLSSVTAKPLALPRDRKPQDGRAANLPADTIVVSADSHLSLAKDIFYDRFPAHLKDRAPRIWAEDGVYHIGVAGKTFFNERIQLLMPTFEALEGSHNMAARLRDMDAEGVDKEIAFPNSILMMMRSMDFEAREYTFRIYNEYLAEMASLAPGRFYGVGVPNYWNPAQAVASIQEAKALGLKTVLAPNGGTDVNGNAIDYTSPEMEPFWSAIEESGLPLSIHISENFPASIRGTWGTAMLMGFSSFRKWFGDLVYGGIFDRHPGLRVVFNECGINWVASMLQDADLTELSLAHIMGRHDWKCRHSARHYWHTHCYTAFMTDPIGLRQLDIVGVDRVLWSSDYPHMESTFGYNWSAMQAVVEATSPDDARKILGGNAIKVFDL